MTTRTHIIDTLKKHFIGKTFTSKDVAARAGASHCYTGKVLNETEFVEVVDNIDTITPRGTVTPLHKTRIFTFNPPAHRPHRYTSQRQLIETALKEHFIGKTFTCEDVAARVGATSVDYTRRVLMDIRGVKQVGERDVEGIAPEKVFTFKPVSLDKWVV